MRWQSAAPLGFAPSLCLGNDRCGKSGSPERPLRWLIDDRRRGAILADWLFDDDAGGWSGKAISSNLFGGRHEIVRICREVKGAYALRIVLELPAQEVPPE